MKEMPQRPGRARGGIRATPVLQPAIANGQCRQATATPVFQPAIGNTQCRQECRRYTSKMRTAVIGALALVLSVLFQPAQAAEVPKTIDYAKIDQIFAKHCLDCHASQEPEA